MLYVVPTPLGNLEDMSARALRALKESSTVFCEDTRRTRALMSHFGLSTPLERYDENDERSIEKLLGRVRRGDDVSLVSDGGCPGVSDPGRRVVAAARREGLPVTALPGPSAVACAVAGSGLPGDSFVFLGFLPRAASKRRRILEAAKALERTIVVYESPFRVRELLDDAEAALGPAAQCVAARELSKVHEEFVHGSVASVRSAFAERSPILGEFVLLFHPQAEPENA
ncbi:MAG TPA: 16S rRNA (cytidine(1402)-2'-O)-methyltransferase [Elusimicrobia bacterium]|nr:MAG: 16S rRNA (cytidine(1402)-2'-O)-methyltransferase [Elusimicrobia bacterium GWA2_66_18]OGR69006.1 MAG: 16S rRNA (cytidine(1402)-2'-O)-methyltransferase [Elusimicrobia bacterium GWC2_65_9]HAZ07039.1 16S rRNA (cytidine(1402)-2'-O)-methyltransferase [Elusimicrobiota bacterium]